MTTQTLTRQQVIQMVNELPGDTLSEVIEFLEFLRFKKDHRADARLSDDEAALLAVIRRHLPAEEQQRLSHLRGKNEVGLITPTERRELLAFVERVEQEDAERAEAMVKLARLRGQPLAEIVREFAITATSTVDAN